MRYGKKVDLSPTKLKVNNLMTKGIDTTNDNLMTISDQGDIKKNPQSTFNVSNEFASRRTI
jgi:hypothetical protein